MHILHLRLADYLPVYGICFEEANSSLLFTTSTS